MHVARQSVGRERRAQALSVAQTLMGILSIRLGQSIRTSSTKPQPAITNDLTIFAAISLGAVC